MIDSHLTPRRWTLHLIGLLLVCLAIGVLYLQSPRFGDDFTYWNHAFDLHERGANALQVHSFHDLRWPVWGVCWLLQGLFNFKLAAVFNLGVASYSGEPLLYLLLGAALSFAFARRLTNQPAVAWSAGILFVFAPLLDSVCYRPMPDLSEGVWGAAAVFAWWKLMTTESSGRSWLWAALCGAFIFIAEANRITGAFIVPVLGAATLGFSRRRFHWLIVAGLFAALFYALQGWLYFRLFGDFFHDIHANLGNKGAKGIQTLPIWSLPFRFLDSMWKGSLLAPAYCLLTLGGGWLVLRHRKDSKNLLGPILVLWFVVLYLQYACAPQSFKGGWNPLIRDADRFLCGLIVPMAVLTAYGLHQLLAWAQSRAPRVHLPTWLLGSLGLTVLVLGSSRERFERGFVPRMHAYLQAIPTATTVFTHKMMRSMTFLVDPVNAQRLHWNAPAEILQPSPKLEQMAAASQEFWYARKLVWLTTRKQIEKKTLREQPALGSFFDHPEKDWVLNELLARGDNPDLIFYRRRKANDPAPVILEAQAPELSALIPALPFAFLKEHGTPEPIRIPLAPSLRGTFARLEFEASSPQVEGVALQVRFFADSQPIVEYLLKPYLYPALSKDFFAVEIPPNADHCEVQPIFSKSFKSLNWNGFRIILEKPSAGRIPPFDPQHRSGSLDNDA